MDFEKMEVGQLEQRKAEIAQAIDNPESDLDALEQEVRAINAELEKRANAAAQKAEIRKAVEQGQGEIIAEQNEKKETRKEAENMNKEYRNAWLKKLQGAELTEEETRAYTQASSHAVPTMVADKMFNKLVKTAPMLDEITLLNVAGNLNFVSEGTRGAATAHTEGAEITAASDTTIAVSLGAIEFVKVVKISKSAAKMTVDAFEDWLVEYLGEDIARAIDNYILNDTTHGAAVKATQIEDGISADYAGVCELIAALPAAYDARAKIVMNKKTLWGKIAGITTAVGLPVFVPDTKEGFQGRLMGYPVVLDDYVADNAVLFGDLKQIVGNLSEGVQVEANESAGFETAQIVYRGYAAFDSNVANAHGVIYAVVSTGGDA